MSPVERISTGVILFIGLLFFVQLAWKRRTESFKVRNFFLGGGSVGPELTEQSSIGLTFAWMGGTWFFTILAYQNGPWVTLLQLPWCFSIILLALLFRRIKSVIGLNTIHGYLGYAYSPRTQVVAAIATTIGYLINTGFEVFWSSLMLAHCLGAPGLALQFAAVLVMVCAIYCMIGGYVANATTDKPQNVVGVISLAILITFVVWDLSLPNSLLWACGIFVAGAVAYSVFSYLTPHLSNRHSNRIQSIVAVLYALVAIAVTIFLVLSDNSLTTASSQSEIANLHNTMLPLPLIVGILSFQLIFNAIDMANWQQVAANSMISDSTIPAVRWAIIRSAMYLLWFPALGGVLLGCALRFADLQVQNETIFAIAFTHVLPDYPGIMRGILLGVITLGFISTTLSTADSYLMSAAQTLATDIVFRREYGAILKYGDEQAERDFVMKCRNLLIPIGIIAVALAYSLWRLYPQNPLDFQALMYAWALTLTAPVLLALLVPGWSRGRSAHAFYAILLSLLLVSAMFFISVFGLRADSELRTWTINLLPITSIFVPFVIMMLPRRSANV